MSYSHNYRLQQPRGSGQGHAPIIIGYNNLGDQVRDMPLSFNINFVKFQGGKLVPGGGGNARAPPHCMKPWTMLHHPSICVPSGDEIQKVVTDVAPQT